MPTTDLVVYDPEFAFQQVCAQVGVSSTMVVEAFTQFVYSIQTYVQEIVNDLEPFHDLICGSKISYLANKHKKYRIRKKNRNRINKMWRRVFHEYSIQKDKGHT